MAKTDYSRNKILDHRYGGGDYARPATVYIGLFTAAPTVNTPGTEVAGNNYARVAVTNNLANWPAAANGTKSNANPITFPQASAGWGVVSHTGIFDALAGGNLLDFTILGTEANPTPKNVQANDTPAFAAGSIVITES